MENAWFHNATNFYNVVISPLIKYNGYLDEKHQNIVGKKMNLKSKKDVLLFQ